MDDRNQGPRPACDAASTELSSTVAAPSPSRSTLSGAAQPDDEAEGSSPTQHGRRGFLASGLAVGAAAGLWACRRAGDTSARKGEPPATETSPDPRAAPTQGEAATAVRRGPAPRKRAPRRADTVAAGERPAAERAATHAPRSRVVQVTNPGAYDAKGQPVGKPVKAMVDQAVMTLTGKTTPAAAWKSLFRPGERVGLKPNCLGRQLCWPHPATVDAIIEGLLLAGVPYKNMVMWDMWGFGASPLSRRYRKSPMQVRPIKAWGFERKAYRIASGPTVRFTRALSAVDAVVNIPMIKDHDLAGVTCSLKNLAFGSIPNPWAFHANRAGERMCDPMVAEIYALPPIRNKARLIVADAFNIIVEGGPKGNPRGLRKLHSVFSAVDPVAMDRIAWTIIDRFRVAAKLPRLDEKPLSKRAPRGRPRYVASAERLGLGTADASRIDHVVKQIT